MRAGLLRDSIVVQQQTTTVDDVGQRADSWSTVATVWADVRHKTGLEAIKAGSDVSTVSVSIRIRYRADIAAGMRVSHRSAVYDIEAVLPDARREFVDLACILVTT